MKPELERPHSRDSTLKPILSGSALPPLSTSPSETTIADTVHFEEPEPVLFSSSSLATIKSTAPSWTFNSEAIPGASPSSTRFRPQKVLKKKLFAVEIGPEEVSAPSPPKEYVMELEESPSSTILLRKERRRSFLELTRDESLPSLGQRPKSEPGRKRSVDEGIKKKVYHLPPLQQDSDSEKSKGKKQVFFVAYEKESSTPVSPRVESEEEMEIFDYVYKT